MFNTEEIKHLDKISKLTEKEIVNVDEKMDRTATRFVSDVKELIAVAGQFKPVVLSAYGIPAALAKKIKVMYGQLDNTSMMLNTTLSLKDIIKISNAIDDMLKLSIEKNNELPKEELVDEYKEVELEENVTDQEKSSNVSWAKRNKKRR